MATQRLIPDAILLATNLSGAIGAVQDDPNTPDGTWLTAPSNASDTELRVSFPTPTPTLSGLQTVNVLVRKSVGQNGTPTASVSLWINGVTILRFIGTTNITGTQVLSGTFDASLVTDPANIEIYVSGIAIGGNPSNRATVEIGAIEINTNYNAPTVVTRTASDTLSTTDTIDSSITVGSASIVRSVIDNIIPVITASYSETVMGLNPVAYWRLDEASAADFLVDATGHGHTLDTIGTINSLAGAISEDANSAMVAASLGDYATVGAAGVLGANAGSQVGWVKSPIGIDSEHRFLFGERDDADSNSYLLLLIGSNTVESRVSTDTGSTDTNFALPLDGEWHLLALTWDGAQATSYLDGVQQAQVARDGTQNHGAIDEYRLWKDKQGNTSNVPLDEVATFDYALTGQQIQSLYTVGTAASGVPPVVFEESVGAASAGDGTDTGPSAALAGGVFQFYIADFYFRTESRSCIAVNGGGLTWTKIVTAHAARSQVGMERWTAFGSPAAFTLTSTLDSATAIPQGLILSRWSGVDTIEGTHYENTDGIDIVDTGSTGVDNTTASATSDSTIADGVHVVGLNARVSSIAAYDIDYIARGDMTSGTLGDLQNGFLFSYDKAIVGSDTFTVGLSSAVDWVTISTVLRPKPSIDTDSITSTIIRGATQVLRTVIDTVSTSDLMVRATYGVRAIADTLSGATGAILRHVNAARVSNDTLTHSDAIQSVRAFVRNITQTLTTTDTFVRNAFNKARSAAQSLVASDSIIRSSATKIRTITQPLVTSDTLARSAFSKIRVISQTLITSDVINRISGKTRALSETLFITDAITKLVNLSRYMSVSLSINDTLTSTKGALRGAVDSIITSDIITRGALSVNRIFNDFTSIANDTLSSGKAFTRYLVETLSVVDTLSTSFAMLRIFIDNINISDAIGRRVSSFRSGVDTILLSESIAAKFHRILSFVDNININDVVARAAIMGRSAIDAIVISVDTFIGNIVGGSQLLVRSVSDTISSINDAFARLLVMARAAVDTTNLAESLYRNTIQFTRTIVISVITSDAITRVFSITRSLAEDLTTSDTLTKLSILIERLVVDAATSVSDVVIRVSNKIRTLPDTISSSDVIVRSWQGARSFIDTLPAISETLSTNLRLILTRAMTDTVSIGVDAFERIVRAGREVDDVIHISDAVSISFAFVRRLVDTTNISDMVSRGGVLIRLSASDVLRPIHDIVIGFRGAPAFVGEIIHIVNNIARWHVGQNDHNNNIGGGLNKIDVRSGKRKYKVK